MGWCKFYQKHIDSDDDPVEDNKCKAPDSLLRDVITCGDCDCFADYQPAD